MRFCQDSTMSFPTESDLRAIAAARAIPAVVVQAKGTGHAGTAMALAPLMHTLFQRVLRHDPADPTWAGRDLFVLSAGHASLALYVQLYLCGYGLTLDDLADSRRFGSPTPGHPELHHTDGVEMSTGPLGQGLASAVGMAIAVRREAALAGTDVLDRTVWVVAGDGDLQEGVTGEAASLAGTVGLENLVVVWDDNRITIDAGTDESFTEDVRARFGAYGWRVLEVPDANDPAGIEHVLREAAERTGRPTLLAMRTVIGYPSSAVGGTPAAHAGPLGADEVAAVLTTLGYAPDAGLHDLVGAEVLTHCRSVRQRGRSLRARWTEAVDAFAQARPEEYRAWRRFRDAPDLEELRACLAQLGRPAPGTQVATRVAGGSALATLVARTGRWFG